MDVCVCTAQKRHTVFVVPPIDLTLGLHYGAYSQSTTTRYNYNPHNAQLWENLLRTQRL